MKQIISAFFLLFFYEIANAQTRNDIKLPCPGEYDSTLQRWIYTFVDTMPAFEEGELGLVKFFTKHFRYPAKQDIIQGKVNLTFIIDADGKVLNVRIPGKTDTSLTSVDKEALRVLNSMSRWKAGSCSGTNVPVKIFWPVFIDPQLISVVSPCTLLLIKYFYYSRKNCDICHIHYLRNVLVWPVDTADLCNDKAS